jgi:hypothetical protein
MKVKHWLVIGFALFGVLFIMHVYTQHGGVAGVKSGIGLG